MKTVYAKAILYSYSNLDRLCEAIDRHVEQRALSSINDCSPAIEQYEKIIAHMSQKDLIYDLKAVVELILPMFSEEERSYIEYKYFKKQSDKGEVKPEFKTRKYYRRQIKLAEKFAKWLKLHGIDDKKFEEKYLKIDFFRQLIRKVEEHEMQRAKNPRNSSKKVA